MLFWLFCFYFAFFLLCLLLVVYVGLFVCCSVWVVCCFDVCVVEFVDLFCFWVCYVCKLLWLFLIVLNCLCFDLICLIVCCCFDFVLIGTCWFDCCDFFMILIVYGVFCFWWTVWIWFACCSALLLFNFDSLIYWYCLVCFGLRGYVGLSSDFCLCLRLFCFWFGLFVYVCLCFDFIVLRVLWISDWVWLNVL